MNDERALKVIGAGLAAILIVLAGAIAVLSLGLLNDRTGGEGQSATPTPSAVASEPSPSAVASEPSPSAVASGEPSISAEPTDRIRAGDEIANAIPIEALPFEVELRRFRATDHPADPVCFADDNSGPNRTMWFSFTPRRSRTVNATFLSNHLAELYVGRQRANGDFRLIACEYENVRTDEGHASGVQFDAEEARTYLLMLRAYAGEEIGWADFYGLFRLVHGSRPPEVSLTISPEGQIDETGRAHIDGTVTCSHEDGFTDFDFADIDGFASQEPDGYGDIYEEWPWLCEEREREWQLEVTCGGCSFSEGPLEVQLHGRVATGFDLYYFDAGETVQLHSGVGP